MGRRTNRGPAALHGARNLGGNPAPVSAAGGSHRYPRPLVQLCGRRSQTGPVADCWCSTNVYTAVSFYEQIASTDGKPRFERFGRAVSDSAVLALSDQAWPCVCDWDGDGDLDLLAGGGYGWPRIVINGGHQSAAGAGRSPAYSRRR